MTSAGQIEPKMTLDNVAPANLVWFLSCNCSGDFTTNRCSCMKDNSKPISADDGSYYILCKDNKVEVPLLKVTILSNCRLFICDMHLVEILVLIISII